MMGFISGSAIPADLIPAGMVPRIGADAPDKMKMLIAKAVVPLPPADLGVALAVLARNESGEVQATAIHSIQDMPSGVRSEILKAKDSAGPVLDVFARVLKDDGEVLRLLVRNEACPDDTVRWMARGLKGEILEFIARNQRRLIRYPSIIEALIANPATPTPTLAPVIETALRNNVETAGIAGFRELAKAFFGDDLHQIEGTGPKPENEAGEIEAPEVLEESAGQGVDTSVMASLLDKGAKEPEPDPNDEMVTREAKSLEDQEKGEEEEEEEGRNNLWAQIQAMTVAEKVRLAVMGDATARAILIRDPKKVVAMAVMKSPRLTIKEVAGFAATKTISDEVIREIARNREYTKNYSIRLALVKNPKCPPTQALSFVRMMRLADVRRIAKARDVPAYVARAARQSVNRKG